MAAALTYFFNFTANGSQPFTFPDDATMIIATGTWGTAQVDISLFDKGLNAYQVVDSWTSATLPQRSIFDVPGGTLGQITVSGVSTTNLNITIKRGSNC